jgi:hypothetical protein
VVSVLRGEGRELDRPAGVTPVSAHGLLAATIDEPTVRPVVHVSPDMVADLHEPRLIISPDYVGRDRRHGLMLRGPYEPARRSTHRLAQAVMVALVTTAAVVPLTLMVAHHAPAAPGPAGGARTLVHPAATAGSPRTPPARAARASTASARSAAREGLSSERAAAKSARAAATADQRAARASSRAQQRSATQAARATRRAEAQASRAARQASG